MRGWPSHADQCVFVDDDDDNDDDNTVADLRGAKGPCPPKMPEVASK